MDRRIAGIGALFLSFAFHVSVARSLETPHPRRAKPNTVQNRVCRSAHLAVRTDLPADEAEDALRRMEETLTFATRYWHREPRGRLACYLARDPESWPDSDLPHPLARVCIGGVGGATFSKRVRRGRDTYVKATIFANDQPGVIEHEVVHGYCSQAFGTAGPDWYKEGMAEFAAFGSARNVGVRCPKEVISALRNNPPVPIETVLQSDLNVLKICHSMDAMLANRVDVQRPVALKVWTAQDAEEVRRARKAYFWSWALCHMLNNNPNYQTRFRSLGRNLLRKNSDSFEHAFGSVMGQVEFEFVFFLRHIDVGYRVDLCAWNWNRRFRHSEQWRSPTASVSAAQGYQASGLAVAKGQRWEYQTEGMWSTDTAGTLVDSNGSGDGQGRLMGVVLTDYRLGAPFELGVRGDFVAPATGHLYLRCRDDWCGLGDNLGQVNIRLAVR